MGQIAVGEAASGANKKWPDGTRTNTCMRIRRVLSGTTCARAECGVHPPHRRDEKRLRLRQSWGCHCDRLRATWAMGVVVGAQVDPFTLGNEELSHTCLGRRTSFPCARRAVRSRVHHHTHTGVLPGIRHDLTWSRMATGWRWRAESKQAGGGRKGAEGWIETLGEDATGPRPLIPPCQDGIAVITPTVLQTPVWVCDPRYGGGWPASDNPPYWHLIIVPWAQVQCTLEPPRSGLTTNPRMLI